MKKEIKQPREYSYYQVEKLWATDNDKIRIFKVRRNAFIFVIKQAGFKVYFKDPQRILVTRYYLRSLKDDNRYIFEDFEL